MREQCEWCEADAKWRFAVPSEPEGKHVYERFGCDTHKQKVQRLLEIDFCKRFADIGAVVEHRPDAKWDGRVIHDASKTQA